MFSSSGLSNVLTMSELVEYSRSMDYSLVVNIDISCQLLQLFIVVGERDCSHS